MGRIPAELRASIAANIRSERLKKYPGRGGGKQCAKDFGVSPQQWSPWERGKRTPDELRLEAIAEFFGVTVAYLRRPELQFKLTFAQFTENPNMLPAAPPAPSVPAPEEPSLPVQYPSLTALMQTMTKFLENGFDVTLSFTPRKLPAQPIQTDAQSQKADDALEELKEFITP